MLSMESQKQLQSAPPPVAIQNHFQGDGWLMADMVG